LPQPDSLNVDLFQADRSVTDSLERLPDSLEEALKLAEESRFVRDTLGEKLVERYIQLKRQELQDLSRAANKREHFLEHYFKVI